MLLRPVALRGPIRNAFTMLLCCRGWFKERGGVDMVWQAYANATARAGFNTSVPLVRALWRAGSTASSACGVTAQVADVRL